MKGIAFISAWLLISLAASYDGYFAWENREDMASWELNPLARWLLHRGGIVAVLSLKLIGISFAIGVAMYCRRKRSPLTAPLTIVAVSCYLFLALHYLAGAFTRIELPLFTLNQEAAASLPTR